MIKDLLDEIIVIMHTLFIAWKFLFDEISQFSFQGLPVCVSGLVLKPI